MKEVKLFIRKSLQRTSPETWNYLTYFRWVLAKYLPFFEPKPFKQMRQITSKKPDSIFCHGGQEKKNILFFLTRQERDHLAWMITIALALELRGHKCNFVNCDSFLVNSCNSGFFPYLSKTKCSICHIYAEKLLKLSKIRTHWIGNFISDEEKADAYFLIDELQPSQFEYFVYRGLVLGEIVKCSIGHFLRTDTFGGTPEEVAVYRNWLVSAVMMTHICERLISKFRPDVVVMMSGMFMPEQVMFTLAQKENIRVITAEIGYQAETLSFHHNRFADYQNDLCWEMVKDIPLTDREESELDKYLLGRRKCQNYTINYWPTQTSNINFITDELQLDRTKKLAVMFTNLTWDSAVYKKDIAFINMWDWIISTINYFSDNQDLQLVIRIHPAEKIIPGASRDSVTQRIRSNYRVLPNNIKVVLPENDISSYTLMEMGDLSIVYTSTMGMEIAAFGKPVMVTGDVHYRGKGFTIDVNSKDEYFQLLDDFFKHGKRILPDSWLKTARRYAYFSFFQSSIPFRLVSHRSIEDVPNFNYQSLEDLQPGKEANLDSICNSIINAKPFIAVKH